MQKMLLLQLPSHLPRHLPHAPLARHPPRRQLVVDPFVGSGTTAVACKDLGRRFVGCDVDPECVAMAKRRLADA